MVANGTPIHEAATGLVLGRVAKTEMGWWGTLNPDRFVPTTCGPAKTLRALTKRMEQLAKKPAYQLAPLEQARGEKEKILLFGLPGGVDATQFDAAMNKKEDTNVQEGQENNTNGAHPKVRTPPKIVAMARLVKLAAAAATTVQRCSGFSQELDDALGLVGEALESARATLASLPDDAKPRRRRSRSGPAQIVPGAAYEIKEANRKAYFVSSDGDASVAIAIEAIDDKNVAMMFLNENKASVKRSHIGKMIATET